MCGRRRGTQFSAPTLFSSSLQTSHMAYIKKLRRDTHFKHRLNSPTVKQNITDIRLLLAYFLCFVSTKQHLSLRWHPPTSKGKNEPLTVHTPSWGVSPFHSLSQFCWAVALWSFASLTRFPQFGLMGFSPFKCLAGNALNWTLWEVC